MTLRLGVPLLLFLANVVSPTDCAEEAALKPRAADKEKIELAAQKLAAYAQEYGVVKLEGFTLTPNPPLKTKPDDPKNNTLETVKAMPAEFGGYGCACTLTVQPGTRTVEHYEAIVEVTVETRSSAVPNMEGRENLRCAIQDEEHQLLTTLGKKVHRVANSVASQGDAELAERALEFQKAVEDLAERESVLRDSYRTLGVPEVNKAATLTEKQAQVENLRTTLQQNWKQQRDKLRRSENAADKKLIAELDET